MPCFAPGTLLFFLSELRPPFLNVWQILRCGSFARVALAAELRAETLEIFRNDQLGVQ